MCGFEPHGLRQYQCLLSSVGPERRFPKPKAARCSRFALGLRPVAEATSCKANLAERIVQEAPIFILKESIMNKYTAKKRERRQSFCF